jgi:Zn-dependent protease with chaperone function
VSQWAAPGLLAVVLAGALALTRPAAASAAPRLAAALELLTLSALALMPPILVACAAATWASASGSEGRMVAGVCVLADGPIGAGQAALYALAIALAAHTGSCAIRAVRAARRAELSGLALRAATPKTLSDGATAWILPSERPAAYCAGIRRPRAVVTSGLLAPLNPSEQEAVLRHEIAHLRLGHPRILILGDAVERAYRFLPPVSLAWRRLRRELEAAADDLVVDALGAAPLLGALAKTALRASVPPTGVGFANPSDLHYRIRRLQQPHPQNARASITFGLVGAAFTAALAASACDALHANIAWDSLAPCLVGFAYLGGRPIWTTRPRRV